jgi:hypothetical protein
MKNKRQSQTHSPFQFMLKRLFVLVAMAALSLGCAAYLKSRVDQFSALERALARVAGGDIRVVGNRLQGTGGVWSIVLQGTPLDDDGLLALQKTLEGLPELKYLYLSGTNISDAGLAGLENLGELRFIDLSYTRVSDRGLVHLRRLRKLRVVQIACTRITQQAAAEFEATTPDCVMQE